MVLPVVFPQPVVLYVFLLQFIKMSLTTLFQAMSSFINQALKGLSQNENIEMLERYQAVTKEEILVAIKRYVLPVFDPQTSVAIVVTAPSKVTSVADDLTNAGYDVEKRTLEVEEDSDIDMEESGSDNDSGSMS